jgi:hypothetical protein
MEPQEHMEPKVKLKACITVASIVLYLPLAVNAQLSPANATGASGSIQGRLWVVNPQRAADVIFPPPIAPPDVTFSTNGITYIGQQEVTGQPDWRHCYTIGTFLNGCETHSFNLKFSGIPNPNLPDGRPALNETPMSGSTWGIIIEFTGPVSLTNGSPINILHDDGVALEVDGKPISGFNPHTTQAFLESVTWTGSSGAHSFDLLYANSALPGGAWLLFFPQLY